MSEVRFISDLHLGHKNLAQRYRGFQDEFYMNEYIIQEWNKVVRNKDLTYILGDITMEKKDDYPLLNRLNGRKKVILGNHDQIQHVPELLKYVESAAGMMEYKGFMLTHCPIHVQELRGWKKNIHGHLHRNRVLVHPLEAVEVTEIDNRYWNVCCDVLDYQPKTLEQLKEIYE